MSKILISLLALIFLAANCAAYADTAEVNSTDLIERSAELDQCEVIYTGEAIGDIMNRGDFAWINVSDGQNAVGIWAGSEDLTGIDTFGRYGVRGDIIKITGIFHRACAEHGGDLDIHATGIFLVAAGYRTEHAADRAKILFSLLFIGGDLTLAGLLLKRRRAGKRAGNRVPASGT